MEFKNNSPYQCEGQIQLQRIAGFFAIQLSLLHNLPSLFSVESLKNMWNETWVALTRGLSDKMDNCEIEEMLKLKHAMLLFCLCV